MDVFLVYAGIGVCVLLAGIAVFVSRNLGSILTRKSQDRVKIQELKVEEARLKLEETREVRRMNQEATKLTEAEARLPQKPLSGESNTIT